MSEIKINQVTKDTTADGDSGVFLFNRDSRGLVEGTTYKLKLNNKIDWRAMVKPEYLGFNRQYESEIVTKYGKPLDQLKVTDVEDKYLIILLSGLKELADLRGYLKVDNRPLISSPHYASATCSIKWMPNFETCGHEVELSDGANASPDNTAGFGQFFLETIALNRSFSRAIRNFLRIDIVSDAELGGSFKKKKDTSSQPEAFSSNNLLETRCTNKGLTFATFKDGVLKKYRHLVPLVNVEEWNSFSDIKALDASTLLEIFNDKNT